jgi:hypothetical protein
VDYCITDPCRQGTLIGHASGSEIVWTLHRLDGSTKRLGTRAEMNADIARLRCRNDEITKRRDELVSRHPALKAVG